MSKRNPGGLISTTGLREPSATDQSQNSGVWTLDEQYQADLNGTWANQSGQAYEIGRSLRFRASAGSHLSRTPSVAGNRKTWTFSCWFKPGLMVTDGGYRVFIEAFTGANDTYGSIAYNSQKIWCNQDNGSGGVMTVNTVALFRDPSAWYHLVVAVDTTQATASNRVKIYINGTQQALTISTAPTLNLDTWINGANAHRIGRRWTGSAGDWDGHMTEVNHIDGQALDPSYFGYFDYNGVWQPKRYTGAYGTNGFYLPFNENATANNLARNFGNGSNYLTNSTTPSAFYQSTSNTTSTTGAYGETVTVSQIIADNGIATGNPYTTVWQNGTFAPANGTIYTFSALVKPLVFPLSFQLYDNGAGAAGTIYTFSDANTYFESIGNITTNSITKLLNGWYRISAAIPYPGSGSHYKQIYSGAHPTGNGSTPHYQIYGVQVNLGTSPDTNIFTSGSAVINDWTPNNISTTAGVTYDSMRDSPTNGSTVEDTGLGGQLAGNYPTFNGVQPAGSGGSATLSNGNLSAVRNHGSTDTVIGNIGTPLSGKWYWEFTSGSTVSAYPLVGMDDVTKLYNGNTNPSISYAANGTITVGVNFATYSSFASGDILGVAYNADTNKVWFSKNGVWQNGDPILGTTTGGLTNNTTTIGISYSPAIGVYNAVSAVSLNCGQRPFAYAAPAGFKCLNTANLPQSAVPEGKDHFNAVTWNGTGSTQTISGVGFQPDFTWVKSRSNAISHGLYDVLRGADKALFSNSTNAESTETNAIVTPTSSGITVAGSGNLVNTSGYTYTAWNWKAGDTTVTNTAGNITSQVRANPTAGFSIVTWTGNGSSSLQTVGTGLTKRPDFIIIKKRNKSEFWYVAHIGTGFGANYAYHLFLNSTSTISGSNDPYYLGTQGAATDPLLYLAAGNPNNGGTENGINYIAYCWHNVEGFSKFGSYVGNGSSDGSFVYTGFKPRWIMYKAASGTAYNWGVYDTSRDRNNGAVQNIAPNTAEADTNYGVYMDILSNGFKCRAAGNLNENGSTYIYAAFAEHPFKTSRAR